MRSECFTKGYHVLLWTATHKLNFPYDSMTFRVKLWKRVEKWNIRES